MPETPTTGEELDELISRPAAGVIDALGRLPGEFAVLGAGGKMGFHVALMLQRALQASGRQERVITVSRFGTPEARERFEQAGFDVRSADLSRPVEVAQLPRVTNVLFLAGVKFGTSSDPELLERMNVTMPALIADHFRDSRITSLSTGCVYSFTTPKSGGSTEDDPTDPPGEYARSCLGRERAFFEASEMYGTRSALIRLNYSNDLRYGVLVDIARQILEGRPVNLETGYVNVIWQGDACAHVIQSLEHADSPPFVLNVTGAEVLRVRDLARRFGALFDLPVSFEGEEMPTAWLNEASRSHRLFGPPQVGIEQMTAWTADWLRQGGETLGKPTRFEIRDGTY